MSEAVPLRRQKTGNMRVCMTGLLFITVFILLIPAAVFSAILTVCPACGYTSIAATYAVAAAGDTIDIQANCNESLTWDKAVNVTSSLQNITWNGAASTAATLTTNGTIGNTAWTISNITMDHSNATGGYTIYLYNNPGPNLTILNCALLRSSASLTNNCVIYADITWSLNSLKLTKCLVAGNNFEYGLYMSGGNIDPSYVLVNTIVKGFNGNMYSALFDGSTNVR